MNTRTLEVKFSEDISIQEADEQSSLISRYISLGSRSHLGAGGTDVLEAEQIYISLGGRWLLVHCCLGAVFFVTHKSIGPAF